ncbi:hypothetical protein [Ignatzschineria cameli]|uniref:hypothetical protein n=1 Tax=Ignatzschineria cameli TaxID=2182793 RepID=UPI001058277C|nr:hypothetical protein [Ignatzschineria cameli]
MSCRSSLSRSSINYAPAVGNSQSPAITDKCIVNGNNFPGIEDANRRACTGEKNEMIDSRRSTAILIENNTNRS